MLRWRNFNGTGNVCLTNFYAYLKEKFRYVRHIIIFTTFVNLSILSFLIGFVITWNALLRCEVVNCELTYSFISPNFKFITSKFQRGVKNIIDEYILLDAQRLIGIRREPQRVSFFCPPTKSWSTSMNLFFLCYVSWQHGCTVNNSKYCIPNSGHWDHIFFQCNSDNTLRALHIASPVLNI